MIRARMSFDSYRDNADNNIDPSEAIPKMAPGQYEPVNIRFYAVYTPDPTSPNFKWSQATPNGSVQLTLTDPRGVEEIMRMIEVAEQEGRKNGDNPTREFYVDIYPAPAEEKPWGTGGDGA